MDNLYEIGDIIEYVDVNCDPFHLLIVDEKDAIEDGYPTDTFICLCLEDNEYMPVAIWDIYQTCYVRVA